MFFDAERIPKIRRMILSTTKEAREIALNQLIPYQKKDFKDLYEVMEGRPVTIRFLDPPLHEFLPNTMEEITALAKDMGVTVEEINMRRAALHEFNYDGTSWMPSGSYLSRDCQDADKSCNGSSDRSKTGKGI